MKSKVSAPPLDRSSSKAEDEKQILWPSDWLLKLLFGGNIWSHFFPPFKEADAASPRVFNAGWMRRSIFFSTPAWRQIHRKTFKETCRKTSKASFENEKKAHWMHVQYFITTDLNLQPLFTILPFSNGTILKKWNDKNLFPESFANVGVLFTDVTRHQDAVIRQSQGHAQRVVACVHACNMGQTR